MLSELTRLKDEATRLLTVYEMYKDCVHPEMRRKAAIDLDRFLMENRETAIILMAQGLQTEIDKLAEEAAKKRKKESAPKWYHKFSLRKGGAAPHGPSSTRDA